MPQANFRLFHAARDACIAGKVESDHGILGMYRLRPQQNGFGLLYTLDPPDGVCQIDPPGLVSGSTFTRCRQSPRPCPISWPPCREQRVHRRPRYGSCPQAQSLRGPAPHHRTSPAQCIRCTQGRASANRFSRNRSLLQKDKQRLSCRPDDQQESRRSHCEHYERPETMILSLSAQGASFVHTNRVYNPQTNGQSSPTRGKSWRPTRNRRDAQMGRRVCYGRKYATVNSE